MITYNSEGTMNYAPSLPQIDIIGAMVIVWRVRGKIIRSVLCNSCVQELCTVQCTHI